MNKHFNLYVPGSYTFENYFLPKIKKPTLDHFPVNTHRHGIQRGGNNHLVVFLDFQVKKPASQFLGAAKMDFSPKTPSDIELFKKIFEHQKEVSLFTISYQAKMSSIAWKLLIAVGDDEHILAEDDGGHFKSGPDWVKEIRVLFKQG